MNLLIHDDYLLNSPLARRLYHEHAAEQPVIDYHCHLDPRALAEDRRFESIADLWVTSDPYKHRAMRIAGIPERCITGSASPREKFEAWAATVPLTLGNPLYAWTALELKRYFDVDTPLSPATAERIWQQANARLAEPDFSARGLLRHRRVECICTSDRLLDDLSWHRTATEPGEFGVWPSLRADDVVGVEAAEFPGWVATLASATGVAVSDGASFREALVRRLDALAVAGCRLSDHGLDAWRYLPTSDAEAEPILARRLRGEPIGAGDAVRLRSALLRFLGGEYARRGWIMQLHLGARRHTSTRLRRLAGPAGGYAAMGEPVDLASLCTWFDDLEQAGGLPRVNLYPLNPSDYAPLAVLTGSFAEDGVAGKLQLGPAWWYNDHAAGMRAHLEALASHGLLATFIGMTTDSRSLLSLVRHEYFRRVLCDWLGEQVARGAMPADDSLLAGLVRRLSYDNARAALAAPPPSPGADRSSNCA